MASMAGFVGLGIMGLPMAVNLAKSDPVLGYDVNGSRFQGLTGVKRAGTLAEIAAQCGVVCLSLPNAAIVEEVILGDGGLIHGLKAGTLVIDLSTSLPAVSRRIAALLGERDIEFADAPVSGGKGPRKAASWRSWSGPARRLTRAASLSSPTWESRLSASGRSAQVAWQSWSTT